MIITVTITRSVYEWLYYGVFEDVELMAEARINIYEKADVEYLTNIIVKYVLLQVCKKFSSKENTGSKRITFKLQEAEAICLFRFLYKYSIVENDYWKQVQRNGILNEIMKQLPLLEDLK